MRESRTDVGKLLGDDVASFVDWQEGLLLTVPLKRSLAGLHRLALLLYLLHEPVARFLCPREMRVLVLCEIRLCERVQRSRGQLRIGGFEGDLHEAAIGMREYGEPLLETVHGPFAARHLAVRRGTTSEFRMVPEIERAERSCRQRSAAENLELRLVVIDL